MQCWYQATGCRRGSRGFSHCIQWQVKKTTEVLKYPQQDTRMVAGISSSSAAQCTHALQRQTGAYIFHYIIHYSIAGVVCSSPHSRQSNGSLHRPQAARPAPASKSVRISERRGLREPRQVLRRRRARIRSQAIVLDAHRRRSLSNGRPRYQMRGT